MKVWISLATVIAIGVFAAGTVMSSTTERPSRVTIAVEPHGSVLAVMSAVVDGLPLFEWSLQGRTETRSPAYDGRRDTSLSVKLMWYDTSSKLYYGKDFDLDARDLSTFGDEAEHAEVRITVGPGADITVTTPHPEALRLVGLNRMDEITAEMDQDVVLAELCALASETDPSADKRLIMPDAGESTLASAISNHDNWLKNNTAPVPRCAAESKQ